jgi:hypothetical protein
MMRFAAAEVSRQLRSGQELNLALRRAKLAESERQEYEVMARDLGRALRVIEEQREELERLRRA